MTNKEKAIQSIYVYFVGHLNEGVHSCTISEEAFDEDFVNDPVCNYMDLNAIKGELKSILPYGDFVDDFISDEPLLEFPKSNYLGIDTIDDIVERTQHLQLNLSNIEGFSSDWEPGGEADELEENIRNQWADSYINNFLNVIKTTIERIFPSYPEDGTVGEYLALCLKDLQNI